jgi:hypothetical protein
MEIVQYSVDDLEILPRYASVGLVNRGHNMKLKKSNCNAQRRANFFGLRVVNTWNQLPENVVGLVAATSVNCFKGRYDRFVLSASYQKTAQGTTDPRA